MNFPVSSIIVIILLLPGVIAQKAYYGHFKVKKANIHIPFTELLFNGIIFSFFIHICGICILTSIYTKIPNFNALFEIVFVQDPEFSNEQYTKFFKQFGLYNLIIFFLTWVSAKLFKRLIEVRDVNLNFNAFKNSHYWYQIFSAKYLDVNKVAGERNSTDLIFVDILTDGDILYSGFVIDFNYSPQKDELENIVIKSTYKRSFNKEDKENRIEVSAIESSRRHTTGSPHNIPGDAFVIPFSKILNVNVHYIRAVKRPKSNVRAN